MAKSDQLAPGERRSRMRGGKPKARYVLKEDLVIPRGTQFHEAPVEIKLGPGHVDGSISLTADETFHFFVDVESPAARKLFRKYPPLQKKKAKAPSKAKKKAKARPKPKPKARGRR